MDIRKIRNHLTYPFILPNCSSTNRVLFLLQTTKKFDDAKIHPALTSIDCDETDCCTSYIEEDFEDWDLKFVEVKLEIKNVIKQSTDDICSEFDGEDDNNLYSKIKIVIKQLSKARSDGFDSWIRVYLAIGNIGLKVNCEKVKLKN